VEWEKEGAKIGNVGVAGVASGAKICEVYQQLVASKLRTSEPPREPYNPPISHSALLLHRAETEIKV